MSEARAILDKYVTEATFQEMVVTLAKLRGYLVFHDLDSRRNEAGLPDLILAHPDPSRPTIFAELKSERGVLRAAQRAWLEALDCGDAMEDYIVVRVWRPSMWDEIEALLSGQRELRTA